MRAFSCLGGLGGPLLSLFFSVLLRSCVGLCACGQDLRRLSVCVLICARVLSLTSGGGYVLVIFLCALFFCTGEVCVGGFHLCALFPCCVSSLFLSLSLSLASSRRWCYSLPTTHVSCVRVFHVSVLCSFFFVALLLSPLCLFFCVLCSLVCSCGGFGPLVCVCGGLSHVSGSKLSSFPRLSG